MARFLDVLSTLLFALGVGTMCYGVYLTSLRDHLGAVIVLIPGVLLVRSAVDLLRTRSLSQ